MANGCRLWLGGPVKGTYGQTSARLPLERCKKTQWVHRLSWLVANEAVRLPEGKEVSHLCHNGRCVEPAHLVAEVHEVNSSRRDCKGKKCSEKHTPYCISQVIFMKLSLFLFCFCSVFSPLKVTCMYFNLPSVDDRNKHDPSLVSQSPQQLTQPVIFLPV